MFITKTQLISFLKQATGALGLVGLHHYGDKFLSQNETKTEMAEKIVRDKTIFKTGDGVETLNSRFSDLISKLDAKNADKFSVDSQTMDGIRTNVDAIVKAGDIINEKCTGSVDKVLGENMSVIVDNSQKLQDAIKSIMNGSDKFISDLNFQVYFDYLNSLTQIQEGSFIHILLFLTILFSIINILAAFLGNELIAYFNLEKKYPKLSLFFRLRVKFQRYYILVNILYILLVSIVSVVFNLLILFYS